MEKVDYRMLGKSLDTYHGFFPNVNTRRCFIYSIFTHFLFHCLYFPLPFLSSSSWDYFLLLFLRSKTNIRIQWNQLVLFVLYDQSSELFIQIIDINSIKNWPRVIRYSRSAMGVTFIFLYLITLYSKISSCL